MEQKVWYVLRQHMKALENRLTDWGVLIRSRHIYQPSLKSQTKITDTLRENPHEFLSSLLTNICSGKKMFQRKAVDKNETCLMSSILCCKSCCF